MQHGGKAVPAKAAKVSKSFTTSSSLLLTENKLICSKMLSDTISLCLKCFSKQPLVGSNKCALSKLGCTGIVHPEPRRIPQMVLDRVEADIRESGIQICLTCDTLQLLTERRTCVLELLMGCSKPPIQLRPCMVENLRKADRRVQIAEFTPYQQVRDAESQSTTAS